MRLAAMDLLGTDPRELRVTVEIPGGKPFVILSDAIAGGAGYCRRLLEDERFSARSLISQALGILECPRGEDCETSCARCLNDYSNQMLWEKFDRHTVVGWLRELLDKSAPRPAHAPASAIRISQTSAAALHVHLEDARNVIAIAGRQLFGAEDRGEALASAVAIRNWLDEKEVRRVFFLTASKTTVRGRISGIDREVAMRLVDYERSGQLSFQAVPEEFLDVAPRMSLLIGQKIRQYYSSADSPALMEGALAGVSHRTDMSPEFSWLMSVTSKTQDLPGLLAALTSRLRVFRFRPGETRNLASMFEPIIGRRVKIHVKDPWCGARQRNRMQLACFFQEIASAGVELEGVAVTWNPNHRVATPICEQKDEIRSEVRKMQPDLDISFRPSSRKDGHFHDRTVIAETIDEGICLSVRWDISSGIDNLMSVPKECSVFVEVSERAEV